MSNPNEIEGLEAKKKQLIHEISLLDYQHKEKSIDLSNLLSEIETVTANLAIRLTQMQKKEDELKQRESKILMEERGRQTYTKYGRL